MAPLHFVRAIGGTLIYKQDASFLTPWAKDLYFWGYHGGVGYYGPFETQEQCETHAQGCMAAAGRTTEETKNVICVDFATKRFLQDGKWTYTKKALKSFTGRYNPGGIGS